VVSLRSWVVSLPIGRSVTGPVLVPVTGPVLVPVTGRVLLLVVVVEMVEMVAGVPAATGKDEDREYDRHR
jgi:hypothetical protein